MFNSRIEFEYLFQNVLICQNFQKLVIIKVILICIIFSSLFKTSLLFSHYPEYWLYSYHESEIGLQFQRFQFMISWLFFFEPMAVQHRKVGACGGSGCPPHGGGKWRKSNGAYVGFQYVLQGHALNDLTYFYRPHLLEVPPTTNSATGWGLSLQQMGLWGTWKIQNITELYNLNGLQSDLIFEKMTKGVRPLTFQNNPIWN